MRSFRSALVGLALALLVSAPAAAANTVLGFPAGNTNLVSVYNASDLSLAATIPAPASSFAVEQTITGSKYYILNRRAKDSIVVVDADSLETLQKIDLNTSASQALMTPDGRYLLVAAGTLRVIETVQDTEVASIPVGGAPTQIIADDTSARAYVLASSGNLVQLLDLDTLQIERTISVNNAGSIALTGDGARLLVAQRDGVRQFRTRDFSEIATVPGKFTLINATLHPIPDTLKVLVQNRGIAPANTSQLVDLNTGEVDNIGNVGLTELKKVVVVNSSVAYAIDQSADQLIEIDLDASPAPTVKALSFGAQASDVGVSPDGRFLYVSSVVNASLSRVDLRTGLVEVSVTTPVAVTGLQVAFGPSTLPPAGVTINGGDDQFFPPDTTLPIPFSVRVTDANGAPLPNVPVFFDDPAGTGIQIEPSQPSLSNSRGIATASVTIPPDPEAPPEGEPAALGEESGRPEQTAEAPEILQRIFISATAGGVDPALFRLTIIRAKGLLKVSGDNQVASENELFPRPLVLLATDDEGRPLPPGTEINLAAFFASCDGLSVVVDPDGFAVVNCRGRQFSPFSSSLFEGGSLSATIPTFQQILGSALTTATFDFSVARGGTQLGIIKIGGDGQTGPTGATLPLPLEFRMTSNFGAPPKRIGVEITQLSGPAVVIKPNLVTTLPTLTEEVEITLGPNAGTAVIQVQASSPGLPTLTYTVTATGGQPTSLQKFNDGQTGKILNPLAQPLRVQVTNESGGLVPFPNVTWRVLGGDATLLVTPDQSGSNALVNFGGTPGQVRVLAAIGNLQTTFTVTSEPPQPASISTFSGQNQTLTTGVLSDPLIVRINEITNQPAAGAIVTFSGPPSVRLHPVSGTPPGNPVQMPTNSEGLAGVQVELLAVGAALGEEGVYRNQLTSTVSIVADLGGSLSTSFLLNVVGRTPSFTSDAIRNAATGQAGVVPGSLASLFGAGLMEGVTGVELAGGATSFRGTQVRIGGIPAPLLALSTQFGEQINLQVPFGLSPGQTTTVEIENNGSRSTVSGVPVFRAQPGIFEIPLSAGGTVAAAIHPRTGTIVTPDTPADHGEVISLFYTGGGPVNPPVPAGTLGPVPVPVVTLPTIVGIDNKGAPVLFTGYAPGFLGLYQVNFQIPDDARCGLRAVSLRVGDSFSPNSTIAIRCP